MAYSPEKFGKDFPIRQWQFNQSSDFMRKILMINPQNKRLFLFLHLQLWNKIYFVLGIDMQVYLLHQWIIIIIIIINPLKYYWPSFLITNNMHIGFAPIKIYFSTLNFQNSFLLDLMVIICQHVSMTTPFRILKYQNVFFFYLHSMFRFLFLAVEK